MSTNVDYFKSILDIECRGTFELQNLLKEYTTEERVIVFMIRVNEILNNSNIKSTPHFYFSSAETFEGFIWIFFTLIPLFLINMPP